MHRLIYEHVTFKRTAQEISLQFNIIHTTAKVAFAGPLQATVHGHRSTNMA